MAVGVREVYGKCCKGGVTVGRGAVQLEKALGRAGEAEFWPHFVGCVHQLLLVGKRVSAVEKLINLSVRFTSRGKGVELRPRLLAELAETARAADKAVRFRSCDFIARLLDAMDADAEITCVRVPCALRARALTRPRRAATSCGRR